MLKSIVNTKTKCKISPIVIIKTKLLNCSVIFIVNFEVSLSQFWRPPKYAFVRHPEDVLKTFSKTYDYWKRFD